MRCYMFIFAEYRMPLTSRGNNAGHAWHQLVSMMPEVEAWTLKNVEVL